MTLFVLGPFIDSYLFVLDRHDLYIIETFSWHWFMLVYTYMARFDREDVIDKQFEMKLRTKQLLQVLPHLGIH